MNQKDFFPLILVALALLSVQSMPSMAQVASAEESMETVVVTATREEKKRSELAESVGVLDEDQLTMVGPSHPAEVLNRIAGVHINNLGGEGHMTSIRQPISVSAVYLFLEDGVPTRPTGYFNHNGLYEINIPQSRRVEVTKGPASALYGSDALGAVINAITKPAPETTEANINLEAGSDGWQRLLTSFGTNVGQDSGLRWDLNVTDTEGFRDDSDYGRYSSTLRFDSQLTEKWDMKIVASYTDVDQASVSSLEYEDFHNNTKKNLMHGDVGNREVSALRLSAEFNYQPNEGQLLTITPFYRDNQMIVMPSWMVSYDPNNRDYQFKSYGALVKFRHNLAGDIGQVIVGIDVDYTPSTYDEQAVDMLRDGDIYTGYVETGDFNYDFETDQLAIAPYVHTEWRLSEKLLLNLGVRYDHFEVDYTDKMTGAPVDSRHARPASTEVDYDELSPKVGVVYQFNDKHNSYISYRHAFRAPTIGQLFRPGSTQDSVDLEPVKSDSFELGFRGILNDSYSYDIAVYDMRIEDDIVRFIDGPGRKTVNAGETSHRGVELSLSGKLTTSLSFNLSGSYTRQKYEDYSYVFGFGSSAETRNYDGFDVGKAPKTTGNIAVQYRPQWLAGTLFEVEFEHVGEYYTDETNTFEYGGHDLVNLRANYEINKDLSVYARVMNLTDELYSTYTRNQVGDPDISYRPGMPRSAFFGVRMQF